jgi:signal transduction histidine kinase/CheY-like chemotaxis protein
VIYDHPLVNTDLPKTTVITLLGLLINVISLWLVSLLTRQSIREQMQSKFFYKDRTNTQWNLPIQPKVDLVELEFLVARFIGKEKAQQCFKQFHRHHGNKNSKKFNEAILLHAETTLARVLGSASAKLVTSFAISGQNMAFDQVAKLVEDNSTQQLEFSRTVLQSAIENVSEGISVIDSELKLVAWNKQYIDIFKYPDEIIYIGCPISQLIHFNLSQQGYFIEDIAKQVDKRIQFIKAGSRHNSEYKLKNGKNIHIEGNPIPGGGFVMIFSDITKYRQTEKVLKDENTDLESRVRFRTAELEQANKELAQANAELAQAQEKAVQAHVKKSQYLKACSHDLLQPLSAARLFSSSASLNPKVSRDVRDQIKQIDNSLEIANSLLLDLNEIARIESGNIKPNIEAFSVKQICDMLSSEFNALTDEYKIEFHCKTSKLFIVSDITLLSRIIQNFLSNAFRYAHTGTRNKIHKVLLGCRRQGDELSIQVFDNGPGIPLEKQEQVFEQFTQLNSLNSMGPKGLGLGLNIAQSLAHILNHNINLKSKPGHGCLFSVNVPVTKYNIKTDQPLLKASMNLQGVGVLCVDNEQSILDGMSTLLTTWQCRVFTAKTAQQAKNIYKKHEDEIDILLVDYQLSDSKSDDMVLNVDGLLNERNLKNRNIDQINGIELIEQLRLMSQYSLPAVLITATTDENLMSLAKLHNISYLRKIIKPLALRALISSLLTKELANNYSHNGL